jgi:hypothetical protein
MLSSFLQWWWRAISVQMVAGSLILTGAGCANVRPPSSKQTNIARAVTAPPPQLASVEPPNSPMQGAGATSTPAVTTHSHRTVKTRHTPKRHRSGHHHPRSLVASSRSGRNKNAKVATTAVHTASNLPNDLRATSIIEAP